MKTAIVTDWFTVYGGAERVLEQVIDLYPNADLYSTIDVLPGEMRGFIKNKPVNTSFIQSLPMPKRLYRHYLPLMPTAMERFDLSEYDLVISSSHAVAKGVLTHHEQKHLCYLQARNLKYAYEDRFLYPRRRGLGFLEDLFLTRLRQWDSVASQRPDVTVANSRYVAAWHKHRHKVDAEVIYPPVDLELFARYFSAQKDDYYVTVGRLEPYKRFDIIIKAFNELGKKLVVIGSGTERARLERIAGDNVTFMGYCSSETIAQTVARARGFVFAAREDFGIALVEAQACGTPVVAYGQGGALETVHGLHSPRPTGVLFPGASPAPLINAIDVLEARYRDFDPYDARRNAEHFSIATFRTQFSALVDRILDRSPTLLS